ncbi:phosphopantetheine-binding protein [Streptomyces sp. NPDC020096]
MATFTLQFVVDVLSELNYDTDEIHDDTLLGPDGLDLDSLSLAEILMRAEDAFGIHVEDDEIEELAGMTAGAFVAALATHAGRQTA